MDPPEEPLPLPARELVPSPPLELAVEDLGGGGACLRVELEPLPDVLVEGVDRPPPEALPLAAWVLEAVDEPPASLDVVVVLFSFAVLV